MSTASYARAQEAAALLGGPTARRPEVIARAMALLNDATPPRRASSSVTVEEPALIIKCHGKVGAARAGSGPYFDHHQVARQVHTADPNDHILVEIDSSGGDTEIALSIFAMLCGHRGLVTTVAKRSCTSAAGLILLAGHYRKAYAGTRFLLHGASYPDGFARNGFVDAATLEADAKYLRNLNAAIVRIYADRATAPVERFRALLAKGEAFDARTAKQLGIVHSVIPTPPAQYGPKNR